MAAGGVSLAFLAEGWLELALLALALVAVGVGVFWLLRRRKPRKLDACTPNVDGTVATPKVIVKPLE